MKASFIARLGAVMGLSWIGYALFFRLAQSDYWLLAYLLFWIAPPVLGVSLVRFMRPDGRNG